jgi:hypothetical protein
MEVKLSSASTISEADLATAVPETNHRLISMVKMQMQTLQLQGEPESSLSL